MTNEERDALIAQGWTPPKVVAPVDPDIHMAHAYTKQLLDVRCPLNEARAYDYFLDAIKKARGLERAEAKAKPKLLWGNHDGTSRCPVDRKAWVIVQYPSQFMIGRAGDRDWRRVSRYAEFDADGAAFEEGEG